MAFQQMTKKPENDRFRPKITKVGLDMTKIKSSIQPAFPTFDHEVIKGHLNFRSLSKFFPVRNIS